VKKSTVCKTDLKLALQQTHAQMKSSSSWPCLSNTCVHSNTLNMQLEWYPSSCDDIYTAKTEVCISYQGYAPCKSRGINFIPLVNYYGSVNYDEMPAGYYLIQQNASETSRKYIKCTQ